jgi:hypothetical protein
MYEAVSTRNLVDFSGRGFHFQGKAGGFLDDTVHFSLRALDI